MVAEPDIRLLLCPLLLQLSVQAFPSSVPFFDTLDNSFSPSLMCSESDAILSGEKTPRKHPKIPSTKAPFITVYHIEVHYIIIFIFIVFFFLLPLCILIYTLPFQNWKFFKAKTHICISDFSHQSDPK